MRLLQRTCWAVLGLMLCCVPACEEAPPAATQDTPAAADSAGGADLASWGEVVDPDKDCKFTPGPGSLTIDVPATWHDLAGPPSKPKPKLNAPRILREVDGDFVLTVKVSGDFMPRSPATSFWAPPYLGAGILLWSDSDNFIRLDRAVVVRDGQFIPYIALGKQEYGCGKEVGVETIKEGDRYLRLERKGGQILAAFSSDGATWKQLKSIDTVLPSQLKAASGAAAGLPPYIRTDNVWPNKLKVGLEALSTSSDPFSAKFEQFNLKTK